MPRRPQYQLIVVQRAAGGAITKKGEIPNAEIQRARWDRNGWGSCTFSAPTTDSRLIALLKDPTTRTSLLLQREIQVWRNGVLIWWGIPVRATADLETVTVQCLGLLWYFFRRFFGPIRDNLLLNPSLELGLTSWTAVNCTATSATSHVQLGAHSARLVQATPGADGYLRQRVVVSTPADLPTFFTLAGHFFIESFAGPALDQRGLVLARLDGSMAVVDENVEPITNSTPTGTPHRVEIGLSVPAAMTGVTLEARLQAPGTIEWDATSLTVQESVATPLATGEDATLLAEKILEHAQDVTWGYDDLGIAFAGSLSGTIVNQAHQSYDNGNIFEAWAALADQDIFDFGIVWNTGGTACTFTVWPGGKGIEKPHLALELGRNVVDFSFDEDGTETANDVRMLGRGDGSDREIGTAEDLTTLGGHTYQHVANAPPEAPIAALDRLAAAELARTKYLVAAPTLKCHKGASSELLGQLLDGDRTPVRISHGWVDVDDVMLVNAVEVEPSNGEALSFTVVPVAERIYPALDLYPDSSIYPEA